ncbi:outer membrane protein assembly factor BamD [Ferribacterium limneticum]|uniref:hypothetical protein n=1 Tax=Ferribacterium limneticum TaxID=76259 RepID=UPI001CF89E33|nr:hypothetical protein [Ferribacterium limneticum]UCV21167.1 hypothetical protein KI613_11410 [Ferribacterium limneticum]
MICFRSKIIALCVAVCVLFTSQCFGDVKKYSEKEKVGLANEWLKQSYLVTSDGVSAGDIERLLLQNNFDDLESKLIAVENKYNSDIRYEINLFQAYEVFTQLAYKDYPNLILVFDNWISSRNSYVSYAAKGFYLAGLAGKFRGTKFVSETPKFNMETAVDFSNKSLDSLNRANQIRGGFLPAYHGIIVSGMAYGNRADAEDAIKKALELRPDAYYIRVTFMRYFNPLWGGSYNAGELFANNSQKFGYMNPRIWNLRGNVPSMKAYHYMLDGNYSEAIFEYTDALKYGDKPNWIMELAYCYYKMNDNKTSASVLERLTKYPLSPDENAKITRVVSVLKAGGNLDWNDFR